MKEKRTFILNTINLLWIIILYYIVGSKSLFLYVLSLSLYNIFVACFNNISIKESLDKLVTDHSKRKLSRLLLLIISVISFLFLLLSILISDIVSILLKINNILPIFIVMGLSIIMKPFIKLLSEYLENTLNNVNYRKLNTIYDILDKFLLLIIALFVFRIFKLNIITSVSLLYLSKIISAIIIVSLFYLPKRNTKRENILIEDRISYKKEIRKILKNNNYRSIIDIVKNSYYYISIIILYLILSTRYNYEIEGLEKIITFIYFYALELINYMIYIAKEVTKGLPKESLITDKLYYSFKIMLTMAIVFGIISPLTCKVIFYDPSKSIYLMMVNFMAIFILLFDTTYENIKNKTVIYISLIVGLILKVILIIPIINSFYRMGYNLVYGDIASTCIGMLISTIINYIYLRNINKTNEKYFERILEILYDNIILCIILILVEFIIPINTDNYFKSLGLIIVYLIISIVYVIINVTYTKIKHKKRG